MRKRGSGERRTLAGATPERSRTSTETAGKIALIERGDIFFSDKGINAAAAGAVAAIIFNDEPGPFAGTLRDDVTIPIVGISRENGRRLLTLLGSGPVFVRLGVLTDSGSQP